MLAWPRCMTSSTLPTKFSQRKIIGSDRVEKLYSSSSEDQLHIQHYLSANCFGDHVARGGIDIPTRELLTLRMLVSLGGCEAQVKGHVSANLRVGNDRGRLIDVITRLVPFIGYLVEEPSFVAAINQRKGNAS